MGPLEKLKWVDRNSTHLVSIEVMVVKAEHEELMRVSSKAEVCSKMEQLLK